MARWLLNRMDEDDRLAVLWIVDRQELVEQAAMSFAKVARSMPLGFERTLRRIHAAASLPTSLADQDLDVAVATRQSVRGRFDDPRSWSSTRHTTRSPRRIAICLTSSSKKPIRSWWD
jgi:hypothetical protein